MMSALQRHLGSPDVTLETHVRRCHAALAEELQPRRAIYLDTKYWIILRDIVAGVRTADSEIELLDILRRLVSAGKAFCPLSESTFAEILKQSDERTRIATAEIIDELSLGVSLIPYEQRVAMELRIFIYDQCRDLGAPGPLRLPWTKLSYVLGVIHPHETVFDASTELAIQKAFIDHMWSMSLSQMVDTLGGKQMSPDWHPRLAEQINAGNAKHADELRSFRQTYSIEAQGAAEVFAHMAVEVTRDLQKLITGTLPSVAGDATEAEAVRIWTKMLSTVLCHEKHKSSLPSLHINTSLHASVRWNKAQQLRANDFEDFRHACSALAYCDIFLTERRLMAMATANHLALDRHYGCKVAAAISDALALLHAE
ncbi:hypothetical protein [Rhodanobacter sp. KK11]|jgi:hypothetical protein|uniref:hypothetical protein n=1 Tax=Rhodanobacter sp. KK11 TaxID=3083255 RepID=UPI0029661DB1|nr:hypothetical protein [Rhodanobacter sp. KK11]MDW2981752.1 hypothetical protein [Rhodanobacter sp. KK11]